MKRLLYIIGFIVLVILEQTLAVDLQLPHFLPDYYLPAFNINQKPLLLVDHNTTGELEQFRYATTDQSAGLLLECIKCDRPRCSAIFGNVLTSLDNQMKGKKGEFRGITKTEIHAKIYENNVERTIFVYVMPTSIQFWSYFTEQGSNFKIEDKFKILKDLANRQRYEEALPAGNISMGHWDSAIHEYACQLLREGRKNEGVLVLEHLLATSPFNYEAHLDFAENTTNLTAAKNSANIVFKNAENNKLINKAAKYLGIEQKTFDSIPVLEEKETGLQLILIPLAPCNLWLLEDAAKTYQKITDVPVKIRRLKEKWSLGAPDRIFSQRRIQSMLVGLKKDNINFNGWKKDRYTEELIKAVESENESTKYFAGDLVNKIDEKPGQYLIGPYLDWFTRTIEKYCSDDIRTMYVGITEIDIYSGDNNYIFSQHLTGDKARASILSYHMMLAETLEEEYQSRQRLTERIAKELVPASLKSLGIPRSTDPTCPYSYSSGVYRLDQKTLTLSDPVKTNLKEIKDYMKKSGIK